MLTFLLFFLLFTFYITVNFSKSYFLCVTWVFLTFRVDYSCSPTWSIYNPARIIYYCSLCCCYNLYSYYFLYNYEQLTFLWHLSISDCCCLLYTFFCLILFDSYTSIWSVNIVMNILIVFLHLFILLLTFSLFYYNFFKNSLF